jgi:hypothetical protein
MTGVTDNRLDELIAAADASDMTVVPLVYGCSEYRDALTALTDYKSLRTALRDAKPYYDPVHLGMLYTARDEAKSPIHAASIDRAIAFIERVGRIEG